MTNERAGCFNLCKRLCLFWFFFLSICANLAALFKLFFAPLRATRLALGAGYHVDNDSAVVLTTLRAGTVRKPQGPALALHGFNTDERLMAPAFRGLRPVAAHSYYHVDEIIRNFTEEQTSGCNLRDGFRRARISKSRRDVSSCRSLCVTRICNSGISSPTSS